MNPLDVLLTLLAYGDGAGTPQAPNGVPVKEIRIPSGDRGARKMVRVMTRVALASLRNPLTIESVGAIIPPGTGGAGQVQALREWLAVHFQFQRDPPGIELLRTPDYLLSRIRDTGTASGDCDDVATLAAALGMAAGIHARFVLYSFGPSLPFTHVFCELFTMCNGWMELDVTRPDQIEPGTIPFRVEPHEV